MNKNSVYFLLGSNIGNSKAQLIRAAQYIAAEVGDVFKESFFYRTAAWGNTNQPDFINQVIAVKTLLTAQQTLIKGLAIEQMMGRVRTEKNAARIIDIDILYFNDEVIKTYTLTVPHPEIANRRFVLVPLTEIAPLMLHPVLHKTSLQMLAACTDTLNVQKI